MGFDSKHLIHTPGIAARFFVHSSGLEAFNVRPKDYDPLVEARVFATKAVRDIPRTFPKYDFVIGALWSDDEERGADIFGFYNMGDWPGNPDVDVFDYREGKESSLKRDNFFFCKDTMTLLGCEDELRRTETRDLAEYLLKSPNFQTIGPDGIILQPKIIDRPDAA